MYHFNVTVALRFHTFLFDSFLSTASNTSFFLRLQQLMSSPPHHPPFIPSSPFPHPSHSPPLHSHFPPHLLYVPQVSQREADIRSKPLSAASFPTDAPNNSSSGRDLSSAIESLPEIMAKKANLEAHTNILQVIKGKTHSVLFVLYYSTCYGLWQIICRVLFEMSAV